MVIELLVTGCGEIRTEETSSNTTSDRPCEIDQ